MNQNERLEMRADFIAGVIAIVVVGVGAYFLDHYGFVNNKKETDPCEEAGRGHLVIVNGIERGCTSDPTRFRG